MGNLVTFCDSIFADAHNCAITAMYKHAYFMDLIFVGLIFTVHESTMKAVKVEPPDNFLLYSSWKFLPLFPPHILLSVVKIFSQEIFLAMW